MSLNDIEQLKKRIDNSGVEGIITGHIREDYEPIGDLMIQQLMDSGDYVSRRISKGIFKHDWKVFNKKSKPY